MRSLSIFVFTSFVATWFDFIQPTSWKQLTWLKTHLDKLFRPVMVAIRLSKWSYGIYGHDKVLIIVPLQYASICYMLVYHLRCHIIYTVISYIRSYHISCSNASQKPSAGALPPLEFRGTLFGHAATGLLLRGAGDLDTGITHCRLSNTLITPYTCAIHMHIYYELYNVCIYIYISLFT